jgi:Ca2+-binding EF-hand superfamily protein
MRALLRRRAQPAAAAGGAHYGTLQPLLPVLPPSVAGGGGITLASLQVTLRGRGLHLTESELRALYGGLDVDGDGTVGLVEFAAAVLPRLGFLAETGPLLRAFAQLDADGDGVIGLGDALLLLRTRDVSAAGGAAVAAAAAPAPDDGGLAPAAAPASLTAAAVALLAEADIDGDGVVTAGDIVALVCGGEPHIL